MIIEDGTAPPPHRGRLWTDWLSVHAWWTALVVGGVLCVVALVLT